MFVITNLKADESLTMKLFRSVKSSFAKLGVHPPSESRQNHRFNGKIFVVYFFQWSFIMLCCVFLFCKARNFMDYTDPIFCISGSICYSLWFTIIVFKMDKFFQLFDLCEEIINKSMYRTRQSRNISFGSTSLREK